MPEKMTLKVARAVSGISQKQLAKQIGVSASTISSWENYTSYPDARQINKILQVLNVSYSDINFLHDSTV